MGKVHGDNGTITVLMGAHRQRSAQEAWESRQDDAEDEEAETGWRAYWSKPWELKSSLVEKFRGLRQGDTGVSQEDASHWDIDTLAFLHDGREKSPIVLMGDPRTLPEYEAICCNADIESKTEASQSRLRNVIGLASVAALVAAGFRLQRSMKVSKSYGFVTKNLLKHSDVVRSLGKNASVQASSGTFKPTYINANLRLVNDAGQIADVDFTATRDGSQRRPWRVVLAKMNLAGKSPH